jgi:hypothetical protein
MSSSYEILYIFIITFLLQLSTPSISSELINNLKNKATSNATNELNSFLSKTLGQMFPTSEVSLSSGNLDFNYET